MLGQQRGVADIFGVIAGVVTEPPCPVIRCPRFQGDPFVASWLLPTLGSTKQHSSCALSLCPFGDDQFADVGIDLAGEVVPGAHRREPGDLVMHVDHGKQAVAIIGCGFDGAVHLAADRA